MKMIAASTKMIGLIGMPLGQSFAAIMQNETYEALGLDYFYFPIELPVFEDFPVLLQGLRTMNFGGMAVTKPFKVEVMKYLDGVEPTTGMIGSCNTVKIEEDGRWIGYNTDGVGALRSLQEEVNRDLSELSFVSFGAGGAGRSVCFELANIGVKKIVITDVNDTCYELAEELNKHFPGVASALRDDTLSGEFEQVVRENDVLLNLCGLGMQPHLEKTPIPKEWIEAKHICFDAVYNPAKTRFLLDAEEKGCQVINGMGMCKYQAARQIEIWIGISGTEDLLQQSVLRILEERRKAG